MSHMRLALSLARRALGSVSPNPAVGAVIVRDGEVVGRGWTQSPGHEHAEIVALREAGEMAAGASMYTTLEPCNHFGRTKPCTEALIAAGIAELHAAVRDPNPNVTGLGLERLEEAGVRVRVGEQAGAAERMIEAYLKHSTTGMPFVTAKFAVSLDGKIATRTGDSKWITTDRARWETHRLRAQSDAVMAGINTVLADDPLLTARDEKGNPNERQPLRVIVDSRARTPPGARLLREPGNTLIAVARAGPEAAARLTGAGAEVVDVPGDDGTVDLHGMLRRLGSRGICGVMVEGGGTLLGGLFDLGLVDKVVAFVAPVIIGGNGAPSPVGGLGVERLSDALRLEKLRVARFGRDTCIVGYC